jgi:hypothetical protein
MMEVRGTLTTAASRVIWRDNDPARKLHLNHSLGDIGVTVAFFLIPEGG